MLILSLKNLFETYKNKKESKFYVWNWGKINKKINEIKWNLPQIYPIPIKKKTKSKFYIMKEITSVKSTWNLKKNKKYKIKMKMIKKQKKFTNFHLYLLISPTKT